MTKYIIKNCPALLPMTKLCDSENTNQCGVFCYECADCLLKRIVEKCKEEIRTNDRWSDSRAFAIEILQLLEIEECEE